MNIRKFWRLSCLSVASLFWASCGTDSNPQFPAQSLASPNSSADANGGGLSDASSSSAITPESSSSEIAPLQSSSSEIPVTNSATAESSSSEGSSSSHSSSSSAKIYALARDPSVTCDTVHTMVSNPNCQSSDRDCDGYKKYLGSDTTISEQILTIWEEKLESCEAIPEMSPLVYGIEPSITCMPFYPVVYYKCSNDSTYSYNNCWLDDNLIYTNRQEYNEAHGISSSSSPESSSSATDLVKSCAQGDFALFVDILADVQTTLYEKFSKQLEEDSSLTENGKKYLEGLLDHGKKAFKVKLAPYLYSDYGDYYGWEMSRKTDLWFNGYIAKTKTCEDGTPVITDRYKDKYDAILAECIEIIENKVNGVSADQIVVFY